MQKVNQEDLGHGRRQEMAWQWWYGLCSIARLKTMSTLHSPTYSGRIPVCRAGITGISGIRWTIFLYVLSLYGNNPAGLIYQIYTWNTRIPTGQIYSWINQNQP